MEEAKPAGGDRRAVRFARRLSYIAVVGLVKFSLITQLETYISRMIYDLTCLGYVLCLLFHICLG